MQQVMRSNSTKRSRTGGGRLLAHSPYYEHKYKEGSKGYVITYVGVCLPDMIRIQLGLYNADSFLS